MKETLSFLRVARKKTDGANGFLYLHRWATGCQQLVFETKEKAEERKKNMNTKQ